MFYSVQKITRKVGSDWLVLYRGGPSQAASYEIRRLEEDGAVRGLALAVACTVCMMQPGFVGPIKLVAKESRNPCL